eukprot:gnl/TRDRNA2_/TRDRNA2_187960_c0_seq1.p1 gnl/TRDRNA2_/TRDRNA2_187960_c0~~gnl/TRDRNA2_/TRDRNA2_187960_c0_seq1.p1  ORF type:complete len:388 (+),score=68.63 gnl/TRDRNA2_/TRDRNA2_187960_c0_seq1:69-1232(+)
MAEDPELCGLSLPTYVKGFHDDEMVKQMRYRALGATGMKVSILSYGASALGSAYSPINEEEGIAVVVDSVKKGINLIDCAPWYGHTVAETILGKAFKQIPREAFYFTTKVARYFPEQDRMFDFTYDRTLQSIDESLARTGLSYIDTIQVHDPEFAPNIDIVVNETLPALQKAKEDGKVRHIGMTGYPLEVQKAIILGAAEKGIKIDTSLVYCHYSLNDTSLIDGNMDDGKTFMDFLDAKGIGCVNASPIAMGLLTIRGPPVWHPAREVPHIVTACAEAAKYCADKGFDISKLSVHFVLRNKRIPTTLVTSANRGRMASNIDAVHETLSAEEEAILAEVLDKFFAWRMEREKSTWVGIEPAKYWRKLGQLLVCKSMYPKYERGKIVHK